MSPAQIVTLGQRLRSLAMFTLNPFQPITLLLTAVAVDFFNEILHGHSSYQEGVSKCNNPDIGSKVKVTGNTSLKIPSSP